jgi:hypothetical protein
MANSIDNILIYYGPTKEFDSLLDNKEYKNIVEIAYENDSKRHIFSET